MPEAAAPLLQVEDLVTGYGRKQVVNGVSLQVGPGEIVALIGHNGAGKSTILKAAFGLLPIWAGRVVVDGRCLGQPTPVKMLRDGVAYVPQGNRVFGDLTVQENLEVCGLVLKDKRLSRLRIEGVLDRYPILRTRCRRRAATLSGGEKQMLALASALILKPKAMLLDEPSLGLAPPLVSDCLSGIRATARATGSAALIVEQKVREVLRIADRVLVLRTGRISFTGTPSELADENLLRRVYL